MTNIAFRISSPFTDVNLTELYDLCEKVVIYEHPADSSVQRTHIHGLLIACKRKEDTIRNRFFKGKYEYSMKSLNVTLQFITYMSKGIYTPKYLKNVTQDVIDVHTNAWVDPNAVKPEVKLVSFDGHLVRQVEEPKRIATKRFLVEVMRSKYSKGMDVETCFLMIREVLMAHNQVLGRWKVVDFYDALLMYADADRWLDGIVRQINKRDG